MINDVLERSDFDLAAAAPKEGEALDALKSGDRRALARVITALENGTTRSHPGSSSSKPPQAVKTPAPGHHRHRRRRQELAHRRAGARLRLDQGRSPEDRDHLDRPSRKRTGGALLGDRIRMNAIDHPNIYMRSLADARHRQGSLAALAEVIAACRLSGFDLVVVETSGIGRATRPSCPSSTPRST
jgi:methylmalonyl-CoA mutase